MGTMLLSGARMDAINLIDFESLAREKLSKLAFDYYASGAHDEITLGENRKAFERVRLAYRVLVDVSARDPSTTVLGQHISMPVMIAPTAFHCMAHPDGELATARAAASAGTIMILSSLSNTAVEEVVTAARASRSDASVWFQLYVYRDRKATEALVARVEAAGCTALVLTVDAPLLGRRERDVRNRFCLPEGLHVRNMVASGYGDVDRAASDSGLASYVASMLDPSLSWKDIAWLRSITRLPLLIKGIVREDDARRAVGEGASGIVVSNHGGRQLDTAPATLDALPRIVDAVGDRTEILVDGGVRRGTDIIKALALGAKAVLLGRPILWGLAVAGEEGVTNVLALLRAEIDEAMALTGCARASDMTRDLIA